MPFLVGVTSVTRMFRSLFRVRMLGAGVMANFDFMFDGMMFQILFRRMRMMRMVFLLRFHCVKLLAFLGGMRMFVAERLHMRFLRVRVMMRGMYHRMSRAMPRAVLREVFVAAVVQVMTRLVLKFLCHWRRCSHRYKTFVAAVGHYDAFWNIPQGSRVIRASTVRPQGSHTPGCNDDASSTTRGSTRVR